MKPSQEEQYLEKGITAIQEFETARLTTTIDEVLTTTADKLHFKGTSRNFKKKSLEASALIFGGKKEVLSFLNKNKYYSKAVDFIGEYVTAHPEEVQEFSAEIETALEFKLESIGFNEGFYSKFSSALKKEGFVGKPGALNILSDTLMDNLEYIVGPLNKIAGEVNTGKVSGQGIAEFISSAGITTEGIKQAYKKSGFKGEDGVIKYVVNKALSASAPYIDSLLEELESQGIKHGTTSKELIESYNQKGIFGREGTLEKVAGIGLNIPGIEKQVYSSLLNLALSEKKKQMKEQVGKQQKNSSFSKELIEKMVNAQFNKAIQLLAMTGVPDEISGDRLKEVFDREGLYGPKGLFNHITVELPKIYANAVEVGFIGESEIAYAKNTLSKISTIESWKDLTTLKRQPYEKFAIAIAQKSESLGISPKELLSDTKYIKEKKATIEEAYGSIEKYSTKMKAISQLAPYLEQAITKIESGELKPEQVIEAVKTFSPKKGIFSEAFNKVFEKVLTRTIVDKTEDYLRLTNGLVTRYAAMKNEEIAMYKTL